MKITYHRKEGYGTKMDWMQNKKTKISLNANQLKLIAIVAMTIDHLTWAMFPGFQKSIGVLLLHSIGRMTMPIMCFFITEGFHYTHDVKRYLERLLVFSVISHFAYNFAFGIPFIPFQTSIFNQTSVLWAYAGGLFLLMFIQAKPDIKPWIRVIVVLLVCVITFGADWSCIATMVILHMGMNRGNFKKQMLSLIQYVSYYALIYFLFIDKTYGLLQMMVMIDIPLLYLYNGKRGNENKTKVISDKKTFGQWLTKWGFYIYYPAHLVLIGMLRIALNGNMSIIIP